MRCEVPPNPWGVCDIIFSKVQKQFVASVQLLLLTIILQLLSKSKEADVVLIDCICIYRSTRTSFNPVILYVWILNKDAPGGLAVALTRNWIFRSRVAVFIYRLFNSFSLLFFFFFPDSIFNRAFGLGGPHHALHTLYGHFPASLSMPPH